MAYAADETIQDEDAGKKENENRRQDATAFFHLLVDDLSQSRNDESRAQGRDEGFLHGFWGNPKNKLATSQPKERSSNLLLT